MYLDVKVCFNSSHDKHLTVFLYGNRLCKLVIVNQKWKIDVKCENFIENMEYYFNNDDYSVFDYFKQLEGVEEYANLHFPITDS
jgi:hypothetical protein